jgi:hypothetical protein
MYLNIFFIKKIKIGPGEVVNTCIPATEKVETGGLQFEASPVRPYSNQTKC